MSVIYLHGAKIKDIEVIGSRIWGKPKTESDSDLLVEYEGNTSEQDLKSLFSMSNTRLALGDLEADITFTKEPIEKWIIESMKSIKERISRHQ